MIIVWLYIAFLIASGCLGVAVLAWAGYCMVTGTRRRRGVAILAVGVGGAVIAFAFYAIVFVGFGGSAVDLLNVIAFLWVGAGFAWAGAMTALLLEAKRLVKKHAKGTS